MWDFSFVFSLLIELFFTQCHPIRNGCQLLLAAAGQPQWGWQWSEEEHDTHSGEFGVLVKLLELITWEVCLYSDSVE